MDNSRTDDWTDHLPHAWRGGSREEAINAFASAGGCKVCPLQADCTGSDDECSRGFEQWRARRTTR